MQKAMQDRLKRHHSWPLEFKSSGKYLGIDLLMTNKRVNATHGRRAKKAKARSSKIKQLMRAHKRGARKLITTLGSFHRLLGATKLLAWLPHPFSNSREEWEWTATCGTQGAA